jgi:hypothetical protein
VGTLERSGGGRNGDRELHDHHDLCAPIHNRMPLILDPNDYDAWLA